MLLISSNVYYRIVFVSLYVIICLLYWITQEFRVLYYKALYKYCILLLLYGCCGRDGVCCVCEYYKECIVVVDVIWRRLCVSKI